MAAIIVDQAGNLEKVEGGEGTFLTDLSELIGGLGAGTAHPRRIIMIPMNSKDRNRHIDVRIFIVDMIEEPIP